MCYLLTSKSAGFFGAGGGRWIKPSGLNFHVCSGSAASATPILFRHNGLASGCRARSPELKFHSCSSLNWVHTKVFGFLVTTMEGNRAASSCVCHPQMESVHREGALCIKPVSSGPSLICVVTPWITDRSSLCCSGCPAPSSMPFLLIQALFPAQRLSLLSSYSSILLLLCPQPVLSFCQEPPALFLPVSMMGSYLLWPGSLDSEKRGHILAPSHNSFLTYNLRLCWLSELKQNAIEAGFAKWTRDALCEYACLCVRVVYMCVHACICVYTCMCARVSAHVYICVLLHLHVFMCEYMCIQLCICVYIHVQVFICICMCACIWVYVQACVYVCVYMFCAFLCVLVFSACEYMKECMCWHIYAWLCLCMHVYLLVCMYVQISVHSHACALVYECMY